jgi:hypothetical protein
MGGGGGGGRRAETAPDAVSAAGGTGAPAARNAAAGRSEPGWSARMSSARTAPRRPRAERSARVVERKSPAADA